MLVVLRLALGWHFLYEGIWKVTHRDQFVGETEGFLSAARGPASNFFYGMVPDIDGHIRLEKELEFVEVSDADGKKFADADGKSAKTPRLARDWDEIRQRFVAYYTPIGGTSEQIELHKNLEKAAGKVYERHVRGLNEFIDENGEKIKAHFAALHRFGDEGKTAPSTDFMRERRWNEMQDFRKEAKGWLSDLDSREKALKVDLLDLVSKDRVSQVQIADGGKASKEKEAKKAETPAKTEGKKTETTPDATKSKAEEKSKDASKEKSTPKAKEAAESGSEEASEDEDAKTASEPKKSSDAGAKPQAADTAKGTAKASSKKADAAAKPAAAESDVLLIDFSSLATGRDREGPFAPQSNPC